MSIYATLPCHKADLSATVVPRVQSKYATSLLPRVNVKDGPIIPGERPASYTVPYVLSSFYGTYTAVFRRP